MSRWPADRNLLYHRQQGRGADSKQGHPDPEQFAYSHNLIGSNGVIGEMGSAAKQIAKKPDLRRKSRSGYRRNPTAWRALENAKHRAINNPRQGRQCQHLAATLTAGGSVRSVLRWRRPAAWLDCLFVAPPDFPDCAQNRFH